MSDILACIKSIFIKTVVEINTQALLNLIEKKKQGDSTDSELVVSLMAECGYRYSEELSYLENMKEFILMSCGILNREKADEALSYIRSNVPKECWERNIYNHANGDYSGYTLSNRKDRIPVVPEYASIESIDVHSDGHYYIKYSNMTVEYYPDGNIRFTSGRIENAWICDSNVVLPVSGLRISNGKRVNVNITVSNTTVIDLVEYTIDPSPVTYW
jgi:hypothetical protein